MAMSRENQFLRDEEYLAFLRAEKEITDNNDLISDEIRRVTDHSHELNGCLEGGMLFRATQLVWEIEKRVERIKELKDIIEILEQKA